MMAISSTSAIGTEPPASEASGASAPPIRNEELLVNWPAGFKVGYQAAHDNMNMTEYVPTDETVTDWSRMMTVQVFHGANISASGFLQGLGKRYMDGCPGTEVRGNGIRSGTVNAYPVSMLMLMLMCPRNPSTDKPETTLFRVIKGADALYAVQWSWRSVPPAEQIDQAVKSMTSVTVCDTRGTEHPCPQVRPLN